jgi:hypothetical protein
MRRHESSLSVVVAVLWACTTSVNANLVLHESTDDALDRIAACRRMLHPMDVSTPADLPPFCSPPSLVGFTPALDAPEFPADEDVVLLAVLDDPFNHHPATWEAFHEPPGSTIMPRLATDLPVVFEPLDEDPVYGAVVVPLPTSLQLALAGIGIMFLARRIRW